MAGIDSARRKPVEQAITTIIKFPERIAERAIVPGYNWCASEFWVAPDTPAGSTGFIVVFIEFIVIFV